MVAVQHVGIEVDAARPTDRSCDSVETGSCEGRVVIDRCKESDERAGKVELTNESVRERDAKKSAAEVINPRHSRQFAHA